MVEHLIDHWHKRMLSGVEPLELPAGIGLVTGCPLWGDEYVDNFLDYCLPTIMAPENRKALDAAGWALVLFVDGPTEDRLKWSVLTKGVPLYLVRVPDEIMDGVKAHPGYKYPLLAAAHNLLIHKARDCGAGFHMMTADGAYSERFFKRLLELGESGVDAIAHTGPVIHPEKGLPLLEKYRLSSGELVVPAKVMSHVAIDYMANQWASWNMDGITEFEEMPSSHYIHVRGKDSWRVYCAHKNATWISNDRCTRVTAALGGTVDSELPRYLAGGFYTPTIEDEMVAVSFAGDVGEVPRCDWATYKRDFWNMIGGSPGDRNNVFLPYFVNASIFSAPHLEDAPSEAELDARFARMMEKLHGS